MSDSSPGEASTPAKDRATRSAQPSLNRPWRALVALVEIVLAAVAVWGAFAMWQRGVTTFSMFTSDGVELTSTHHRGGWIAGAIGLGTLASLLLLDACRELMLALRTRRRRARNPEREPWPNFDEDFSAQA